VNWKRLRKASPQPDRSRYRAAIITAAAVFAILWTAGARAASDASPRVAIFGADGVKHASVRVEIADDEASRERGLMFRAHLDEDAGMVFVFRAPSEVYFWMKNTEIPLDMIFADQDGHIVGIVADAKPYSEKTVGPGKPAQYVLEVNSGFCKRHGIATGDWMRFSGFTPQAKE
jgi:uncharacterized membrane protein (UPF0127 family)